MLAKRAGRLIRRRFIARLWAKATILHALGAKATVIEACYVIRYDWLLFLTITIGTS